MTSCATCHRLHGQGFEVGPSLSSVAGRDKKALLTDILDPNRAIDAHYLSYVARKKDGTVLTGILAAVTASSFTLRRGEGQEDVVLRQDIEEMKSSGVSLMPEGLEKNVPVEAMADLIAFIRGWRFIDAPEREKR